MTLDWDAYTNKIIYDTLHPVDHTTAGGWSSSKLSRGSDSSKRTDIQTTM